MNLNFVNNFNFFFIGIRLGIKKDGFLHSPKIKIYNKNENKKIFLILSRSN